MPAPKLVQSYSRSHSHLPAWQAARGRSRTEDGPVRGWEAVRPCRVLIVDDFPIVRHGLQDILSTLHDVEVCGEAADGEAAWAQMGTVSFDLILLDIGFPRRKGLDVIRPMLKARPQLKIAMLDVERERSSALRSMHDGACGYFSMQDPRDALREGIQVVIDGRIHLCPPFADDRVFQMLTGASIELSRAIRSLSVREYDVFAELSRCNSAETIAENLQMSVKTVETHRMHIMEKLKVDGAKALRQLAQECMHVTISEKAGHAAEADTEDLSSIDQNDGMDDSSEEAAEAGQGRS